MIDLRALDFEREVRLEDGKAVPYIKISGPADQVQAFADALALMANPPIPDFYYGNEKVQSD